MKESVLSGEDVLFHWSMLTTDIEDDKAEILLVMLVDLYITIHGAIQAKNQNVNSEIKSFEKDPYKNFFQERIRRPCIHTHTHTHTA